MKILYDYDQVPIVKELEARQEHFYLNWIRVSHRFRFDVNKVSVITLGDLKLCIRLFKENIEIKEVNYSECHNCSVCKKVLLPDDEAYTDHRTGDTCCTEHCYFSEKDNNYHKIIF